MEPFPPNSPRRHQPVFLTNYALVLVCVSQDPDARVRDVAQRIGITERATLAILAELERTGYLERIRSGRRTHYRIRSTARLPQPLTQPTPVGALLQALTAIRRPGSPGRPARNLNRGQMRPAETNGNTPKPTRPRHRRLTASETMSLPIDTELLYEHKAGSSSPTLRRVTVTRYQQVGGLNLLIVELDDGSERSPAASSLYWPTPT
jgi:Winged helix DNA-binding domain